MICKHCADPLCQWELYEYSIISEVESMNSCFSTLSMNDLDLSNRMNRKKCYRVFIAMKYGYLGNGNRKKIPKCVLNGIRMHYPDSNEDYMGHKDS